MARHWAFAVLVIVAMVAGFAEAGGGKDVQIQGKFSKDDPKDPQRGGPSQTHVVPMKAGKAYAIDMVSGDVDSYLRLLDAKGNQLDEDDDSGGNLNARIIFNCTRDADYKIVCTTFGANTQQGSYVLTVKQQGVVQKPSNAHVQMIDQEAPEFRGDFAVNGRDVKLSDLQGKVVLLCFCDIRSSSSVSLLPRLSAWATAHKADGLTVVGVTFYASDIDQRLGFDKESGKVITVEKADRKSDRAVLRRFADHHKIGHLLLALPRQEALNAFNAYAVNSMPQVVLIDRKGVVRLIDINGAKNTAQVETEIKKLLAEN